MPESRVIHITLERCGSQWVKDVLTHRDVIGRSGLSYSNVKGSIASQGDMEITPNTLSGPIYNMNQWEWRYWRKPGDRAVVVIRDPRDILVSLMFAWLYSHPFDHYIQIVRRLLAALPDNAERLTYVMGANGPYQRMMWSWTGKRDDTSILLRYEDLVGDPPGTFQQMLDWLGWDVSPAVLAPVIEEFSFKSKVGREMGQQDVFSHHRRGLPGDWRNHFNREHGRLWETLYPGLVKAAGYEETDDWWCGLPEPVRAESDRPAASDAAVSEAMRFRNAYLEREIEDKEKMIRDLTTQCEQRLASINEKEQMIIESAQTIVEKERMIDDLAKVCEERQARLEANRKASEKGLLNNCNRLWRSLTLRG